MAREVTGDDGINWNCLQAYAGLSDEKVDEKADEAAARAGGGGNVRVVCTPSGGAKSVSLELPQGWETSYGDEELLGEIEAHRET